MSKLKKSHKKLVRDTLEGLLKRDGAKCDSCGRKEYLTVEHIIPQYFLKELGMTMEELYTDFENLRVLCRPCNTLKANHFDFSTPKTKELIIKYLQRI